MIKGPISARQLLRDAPAIHQLLKQADTEQQRLAQLKQLVPAELAAHCIETHVRGNKLIVFLSSPGWASRLRLIAPKIAKQLGLSELHCRIQPPERQQSKAIKAKIAAPQYSSTGAAILGATAVTVSDPELGKTLARLAKAVKPKN